MSVEEATMALFEDLPEDTQPMLPSVRLKLKDNLDRLILEVQAAGQCGRDCTANDDRDECLRCWAENRLKEVTNVVVA